MKKVKRICKTAVLAVAIMSLIITSASAVGIGASDWSKANITTANRAGILPQYRAFIKYTSPITRADIAEVIAAAYENVTEKPYYAKSSPFSDARDSDIATVYELGIMNGRSETSFDPYAFVTRQEAAKIILSFRAVANGEKLSLPNRYDLAFTDADTISDWAKPYVAKASAEKIINGFDDGRFGATDNVSWEQAVTLIVRAVELNLSDEPAFDSLNDGDVIPSGKNTQVTMINAPIGTEVYAKKMGGYSNFDQQIGSCNTKNKLTLNGSMLDSNSVYYLYAVSDGVLSEPITVYTDDYTLMLDTDSFADPGPARLTWNKVPSNDIYTVKVTECRASYYEGDIPPNETLVYELAWENYLDITFNPNRRYTVEITSGKYSTSKDIYVSSVANEGWEEIYETYPTTKEEADALMTKVTVPIWKMKSNGQKYSSSVTLTVHHVIAERVKLVFEEIYNGPEQFPIKDIGAYNWRGGTTEHNSGTAIDINANENYCVYDNGATIGSHWKPYEDPYSITPYGDVIKAFEKYGFTWGGDSWSNPKDYMHFSYLGT